jgi:hypothetical protein
MTPDIVRKLAVVLSRGVRSEPQALYVLVQARKILERVEIEKEKLNDKTPCRYPVLKLYGNWVAHIGLEYGLAKEIVKEVDRLYPRIISGTLTDEEKEPFRSRFSFREFRREFDQFLVDHNLPQFRTSAWRSFLLHFLGVIQDCPLSCEVKDGSLKHVDTVMLITKESAQMYWSGTLPEIIWTLHFGGKQEFMMTASLSPEEKKKRARPGDVP